MGVGGGAYRWLISTCIIFQFSGGCTNNQGRGACKLGGFYNFARATAFQALEIFPHMSSAA